MIFSSALRWRSMRILENVHKNFPLPLASKYPQKSPPSPSRQKSFGS